MCQNIQCLTNKIDDLNVFLTTTNIDIIVINEHWLLPSNYQLYTLEGYELRAKFLRQAHEHGGVAIFTRTNIKTKERVDIRSFTVEFVVEFCAVEIIDGNLLIVSVYRPERDTETFFTQIQALLEYISKHSSRKRIIIAGDINIDVTQNTQLARRFLNLIKSFGLKCLIKDPTRETLNSSSCIDQFIVSGNVNMEAEVKKYHLSDHHTLIGQFPIHMTLHHDTIPYKLNKRLFNTRNMEGFRVKLGQINWQKILELKNDVNTNYNYFNNHIKVLLETHIQKKKIILNYNKKNKWITKGIRRCCYHKRILRLLTSTYKNENLKIYTKLYSTTLKKILAKEKRKCYINRINNSRNKYKEMWNIINEKTKPNKNIKHENICLKYKNLNETSPTKVAEIFNEYYVSIGSGPTNTSPNQQHAISLPNTMYLGDVTESDVKKAILSLKRNNSCGYDEIPGTLLVYCVDEFVKPLTFLINQSYDEGICPEALKLAVIKPVFKKGDKLNVANYRPIALLPVISKIFEKIICQRMNVFLEKYNVLNVNQHGFRKNRSTITAVFECNHEILNALNKNHCVVAIFMDISKAYNCVLHDILIKKLELLGIRGKAKSWLESYLLNRKQFVEITHLYEGTRELKQIKSSTQNITGSIPQGSVLGCLLFLAYINELPSVVTQKIVLFADDATLLVTCEQNNIENLQALINDCQNKIVTNLKVIGLTLNFRKAKMMQFRPYQTIEKVFTISHQGHLIEQVQTF